MITLREANAPLALVGTSRKVPSIVIFKNVFVFLECMKRDVWMTNE